MGWVSLKIMDLIKFFEPISWFNIVSVKRRKTCSSSSVTSNEGIGVGADPNRIISRSIETALDPSTIEPRDHCIRRHTCKQRGCCCTSTSWCFGTSCCTSTTCCFGTCHCFGSCWLRERVVVLGQVVVFGTSCLEVVD